MLRNQLSQKQLQKLSPQQIQLMKLLQIPTAALEQRIQEELESNPALEDSSEDEEKEEFISEVAREKGEEEPKDSNTDESDAPEDDFAGEEDVFEAADEVISMDGEREEKDSFEETLSDYMDNYDDDDTPAYKLEANNYSEDDEKKPREVVVESSFYEYLKEQLGLLSLGEREQIIAEQIIGTLNDDGYLDREISALCDDLLFTQNLEVQESEVLSVLKKVQTLDPAGIAAQNLRECLLLQLDRQLHSDEHRRSLDRSALLLLKLAHRIIFEFFEEFTKKHYARLQQQLGIDRDDLRDATEVILRLQPKPGSLYGGSSKGGKQYILPDFLVTSEDGDLEVRLHGRNAPDLRVSDHYKYMLQKYASNKKDRAHREAANFIRGKMESARWFIDALRQRQATMLRTMSAIMNHQRDFFLTGDERKLRPMILKDIAEITGLDISTVSRVANSKYVQTEFGTKLLKSFFSESLQTDSGDEVSTREVKKILTDIIGAEEKRKPYSDEKLKSMLQKRGYNIARRTVAKYREQLNIPVARLRKEI